MPPDEGAATVTVACPSPDTTVGVPGVPGACNAALKVKAPLKVSVSKFEVTTTSAAPALEAAEVVQVIEVLLWDVTLQATPPICTVEFVVKLVPKTVTEVPPDCGPLTGEMLVASGPR